MTVFDSSFLALALGFKIAAFGSIIVGLIAEHPSVRRWTRPATVTLLCGLWGIVFTSSLVALPWALPSFLTTAALWLLALVPPCKDWGVDPYTLIYPAEA